TLPSTRIPPRRHPAASSPRRAEPEEGHSDHENGSRADERAGSPCCAAPAGPVVGGHGPQAEHSVPRCGRQHHPVPHDPQRARPPLVDEPGIGVGHVGGDVRGDEVAQHQHGEQQPRQAQRHVGHSPAPRGSRGVADVCRGHVNTGPRTNTAPAIVPTALTPSTPYSTRVDAVSPRSATSTATSRNPLAVWNSRPNNSPTSATRIGTLPYTWWTSS